jgi:hypothetical protein
MLLSQVASAKAVPAAPRELHSEAAHENAIRIPTTFCPPTQINQPNCDKIRPGTHTRHHNSHRNRMAIIFLRTMDKKTWKHDRQSGIGQ